LREQILENLNQPELLERLYRSNPTNFKKEFDSLYPTLKDRQPAQFWHERLHYEGMSVSWGNSKELAIVMLMCLFAACITKLPTLFHWDQELFLMRNIGFIVFPVLSIFYFWKQSVGMTKMIGIMVIYLIALVYINVLEPNLKHDTPILAYIHLPLFLWTIFGISFVGDHYNIYSKRIEFLRFNGDLIILSILIFLAGVALTIATLGLFSLIKFDISKFYVDYIVRLGLASLPIVSTYIIYTNPQLVHKVSPLIARLFSPLVLITLVCYLIAIAYTQKDPYNDREFLLIFNGLLIGVMAIIVFSIAETARNTQNQWGIIVIFLLSVVTILVNGIALSAILYRISEWGITPNRMAVLGGNILILIHIVIIAFQLFRMIKYKKSMGIVEQSIAKFLPVYIIWTFIVTFLFPVLFGFK
jgi:hypothetical protein